MRKFWLLVALLISFPILDRLVTHEVLVPGVIAGQCPSPMEYDPQFGWLYTKGLAHFHAFIYTEKGFFTIDIGLDRAKPATDVIVCKTVGLFGTTWKVSLATDSRLEIPQSDQGDRSSDR